VAALSLNHGSSELVASYQMVYFLSGPGWSEPSILNVSSILLSDGFSHKGLKAGRYGVLSTAPAPQTRLRVQTSRGCESIGQFFQQHMGAYSEL